MDKTDNELIAEFMGMVKEQWRLTRFHKKQWYWCYEKGGYGLAPHMLKYDTSWDWLMPVVERIESIATEYGHWEMELIWEDGAHMQMCRIYEGGRQIFNDHISRSPSKKLAVYGAVVEFIKWHNEVFSAPIKEERKI